MADPLEDPDKKARWLSGTAVAMLLAGFVGFLPLVSWFNSRHASHWHISDALSYAAGLACISFWLFFPIMYFGYIRKSSATLEYQRLVREGEQIQRERAP